MSSKVISDGRKLLLDFEVELTTLVAMKLHKETRFFSKICETTSAVTVFDVRDLPTGYAVDFT